MGRQRKLRGRGRGRSQPVSPGFETGRRKARPTPRGLAALRPVSSCHTACSADSGLAVFEACFPVAGEGPTVQDLGAPSRVDVALLPPDKVSLFHQTVVGIPNFRLGLSVPSFFKCTFSKSCITSEDAVKTALHSGKLLSQ